MYNIDLTVKTIKDENGKNFNAYETFDKNGNKINVRFTQDVKPQPPKNNCTIKIIDGWRDMRKKYPTIRIKSFEIVEKEQTKKDTLCDLFD